MVDDQQFCLRWNSHQSTLVSVFDTLLENGTLVDCTLAAEGKYLKAHKVVLSACSPYFEALLSQQYDKHPIFILKDVKFQELKAMMDYMYRGEVNISQDQLAALLKAAESLQIKGLSDSRGKNESEARKAAPPPPPAKTPPPAPTIPRVQGLTIEQRKAPKLSTVDVAEDSRSREGSISPVPRKRKKPRRRSHEGLTDNHDASNSSESHSNQTPAQNIPTSISAIPLASTSKLSTDVPEPTESKSDIIIRQKAQSLTPTSDSDLPQVPTIREKLETHSELMLEPKSEYLDDDLMNEDSVEDLTLDDDDINNMEGMDHSKPGPSHGSGDGSSQDSRLDQYSFPPNYMGSPRIGKKQRNLRAVNTIEHLDVFAIEPLLDKLSGTIRKYSRNTVGFALDSILNRGHSVSSTSDALGIKRTSLQHYLKKLQIVLRPSVQKTNSSLYYIYLALLNGFSAWHMAGNQSQDEIFLVAQEAVGAHRDSQENITTVLNLLRKLLTEVKDIKQRLDQNNGKNFGLSKNEATKIIKGSLPLETQEAVSQFQLLLSEEQYYYEFVRIIQQVGGSSGKDNTERVLSIIFSPLFAKDNTWEGKKNKFSVKGLSLIGIVEEIIMEKWPNWNNLEFSKTGINWFRLGNQRSGNQPSQLKKKDIY